MSTGIYRTVNGERVELNARQVKAFIMKVNKWTSEEYNRQRYITKNKLRTYEAFSGAKEQSPTKFLYFEAKAKQRAGANYKPSLERQRIQQTQSLGSAKAIAKAKQSQRTQQSMARKFEETTQKRFKGLIENNPKAKEIWEKIKDPYKREQALKDYANRLHLKMDEQKRVAEAQPIPFGETFGSDVTVDFNVEDYE